MSKLSRKNYLAEKVVFVDGLPGCGKTLFSSIISAMDKVELLSYSYDIEHICQLFFLGKIPIDAAKTMVRIQSDLKLYNTMMGRDVNFRPSDLSSVHNYYNPSKYFKRLDDIGDAAIPQKIVEERPILNFSVHNMLAFSEPVWEALGKRCVFVEIVRHPLYMIRQQVLNMQNMIATSRSFAVYFEKDDNELIYYAKGWEELYIKSNPYERAIYMIDNLTKKTLESRHKFSLKFKENILTIPFEQFVLNEEDWVNRIAKTIGTNIIDVTRKVIKQQNVPREMVAEGVDIEIYRRCGWKPPGKNSTERDELNIRREEIAREVRSDVLAILDRLSSEYENKYWKVEA
jgi:hypothetical protein